MAGPHAPGSSCSSSRDACWAARWRSPSCSGSRPRATRRSAWCGSHRPRPSGAVLEARQLVKSYRTPSGTPLRVLDHVDLVVPAGRLTVVLGPSGCGKSTLLNVLGLLEDADGGEVLWDGERVSALGRSARSRARARVGFVFQSFLLLPSLTALDNVVLAGRYAGRTGPETRRHARELLARFGVLDRQDHYPPQLSGGEQQRVAFCRAILNDPPLLLADEPTGNLDDANGRVILEALRERAREGGAVVVVSHRADAVEMADDVYHMRLGRLEGETVPAGGRA